MIEVNGALEHARYQKQVEMFVQSNLHLLKFCYKKWIGGQTDGQQLAKKRNMTDYINPYTTHMDDKK